MADDPTSLRFPGHSGDPITGVRFAPSADGIGPLPGIVLAHDEDGIDDFVLGAGSRLTGAGFVVLAPELCGRESPDPSRSAPAELPDRRAVGDLEAAAAVLAEDPHVDPARVAAVGLGMGGTLAFLLGCQSRRLAAVVDICGRLRYAELGPQHPVQPLEMSLNLSCPLLAVFGELDDTIPQEDVEVVRERLAAFAKPAEVVVVPDVGHGFMNSMRPTWNESAAEKSWARVLAFLEETL